MSNSKLFNMFEAAATASKNAAKAHEVLLDRAADLLKTDISVADISRDGRFLAMFQEATAKVVLTAKELPVYLDTSLATSQRVKTDDGKVKQIKTERGRYEAKVNAAIKRVRDAMKAVANDGATRGAKTNRTPTEVFIAEVENRIAQLAKPDASDKFDFDPVVARGHLVALIKAIC